MQLGVARRWPYGRRVPSLVDLLIPLRCAACGRPASRGLCDGCLVAAIDLVLPVSATELIAPNVAAVGAFAYDGVIRDAVRGMKAAGRHAAAVPLGALLRIRAGAASEWVTTWVPSTPRRLRERGFDVPRLLAGPGAVPLLRRRVDRPDQTTLSAAQRRAFPADAFVAVGPVPADVLLVDDVRTTGATASAAAGALLSAGAARVLVVTLAIGGDSARARGGTG
jgi:predicted amidophosphoribosyltransferase